MASISSLMSSGSSSSIYGSRNSNIISGLASGMDTEAMIEGMVQGYQQKITQLGQDRTMLQWQQSAYQSISDKLVEFPARLYVLQLPRHQPVQRQLLQQRDPHLRQRDLCRSGERHRQEQQHHCAQRRGTTGRGRPVYP